MNVCPAPAHDQAPGTQRPPMVAQAGGQAVGHHSADQISEDAHDGTLDDTAIKLSIVIVSINGSIIIVMLIITAVYCYCCRYCFLEMTLWL